MQAKLFTSFNLKPLVYRYDVNHCPACGCGIKKSKYLAHYLIGPMTAVAYLLCKTCGKQSRTGLPEAKLQQANERLEAFAVRAGLVQKGGDHAAS